MILTEYVFQATIVTTQAVMISRFLHRQPLAYTERCQQRRIRVLLMTLICCFLFLVCWTPHHTLQLMMVMERQEQIGESFTFMVLTKFLCKYQLLDIVANLVHIYK